MPHNAPNEIVQATYESQGFAVFKNVLPVQATQAPLDALGDLFDQVLNHRRLSPQTDSLCGRFQALFDHDVNLYLNTLRTGARLLELFQLLTHPKIVALTQRLGIQLPLFQNQPVLHVMAPALRIPGGYYGLGVHQDWPSMQGSLDTLIIWLPLTPVTAQDFPVEVWPGSHLKGLCQGEASQTCLEVPPARYKGSPCQPVLCQPGDVVVMSSFLFHRSAQHGSAEAFRIAASLRYENGAEPTFVDRGFPTCQERVVHRELITPDFPSVNQVRAIFNKEK